MGLGGQYAVTVRRCGLEVTKMRFPKINFRSFSFLRVCVVLVLLFRIVRHFSFKVTAMPCSVLVLCVLSSTIFIKVTAMPRGVLQIMASSVRACARPLCVSCMSSTSNLEALPYLPDPIQRIGTLKNDQPNIPLERSKVALFVHVGVTKYC